MRDFSMLELKRFESTEYHPKLIDVIFECFNYPNTPKFGKEIAFNKKIDTKIEDLQQEVTLEGKRIVDQVVLGLLDKSAIPNTLHILGEMANLAKSVKI